MNENFIDNVKTAIAVMKKCRVKGDVFGSIQNTLIHEFEKGELSSSSQTEEMGLAIRVVQEGRVGFGYCVPGNETCGVNRAIELASLSPVCDVELPHPQKAISVPVCDSNIICEIADGTGTDFLNALHEGVSAVKNDIALAHGELILGTHYRVVANTEGVLTDEDSTILSCGVHTSIPGTSLRAREIRSSRKLDIDFEEVGRTAGGKVHHMRKKWGSDQLHYPVILSPHVIAPLLWFTTIPALMGEQVRTGQSIFEGICGQQVASEEVTIIDDPTRPWGLGSGSFDDEGVVSSRLPLIVKGTLKGFLYDLKDGAKSEKKSTGNGVRTSFRVPPQTKDRNIMLEGGKYKKDELFEGTKIYVDKAMGIHTANPISGDFSVAAAPALVIKQGENKGRVDTVMLSGNFPHLLHTMRLGTDYQGIYFSMGSRKIFSMEVPSGLSEHITVTM